MGAVRFSPEKVEESPSLAGFHNDKIALSKSRVIKGSSYKDCSTVCLLPLKNEEQKLHFKVADAFRSLMVPMNQGFFPMRLVGMEVADAYNQGIKGILDDPQLSKMKFVLTFEHDNVPPPDGLIKLIETITQGPWAGVGGLYWTKGEDGLPMIYGNPNSSDIEWRPQPPVEDAIQECRGIAMGFSLWDIKMFKDKRLGPPWFETVQEHIPWVGGRSGTQDLQWCQKAGALGYRFCVDNRVRVGHVQLQDSPTHPEGFVW